MLRLYFESENPSELYEIAKMVRDKAGKEPTFDGLAPCPFCGRKVNEPFYHDPYDGYQGTCGYYIIRCHGCGADVSGATQEDAILKWNRRPRPNEV